MSEAEKSKPNKESTSTSTATLAPPPAPPAVTTTSKVSSSTTSTTSSTSVTSSSSTATSPGSNTSTSNANAASSNANNIVSSTSGNVSSSTSTTKTPGKPPPPLPPPPPPPPKLQPSSGATTRSARLLEISENEIRKAFADFMKDPECLDKAADYLYESLLEDAVMGVYLEVHQSIKTGALEAIEGEAEDDTAFKIVETQNFDVFGMSTTRKAMDCTCPNCDRPVAAARFAPHLEKCMGMGRKTSRTASRRLANAKEGNSSYFSSNVSDDEDDADWSSEKRRKKIQPSRTNGSKKNGKAS